MPRSFPAETRGTKMADWTASPSRLVPQLLRRDVENASLDLHNIHTLGAELNFEEFKGGIRIDLVAAHEDIQRTVTVFGPGVNGKMGLGYDDDAADAVRRKFVENRLDDGGFG